MDFPKTPQFRNLAPRGFAKSGDALPVPDLIEIQTVSYSRFLQEDTAPNKRKPMGLEALLREIFPIESYDGKLKLTYLYYELGKARYNTDECRQLRLTYGMQGGAGDGLEPGQVDLPPIPPPGTFDVRWLNIPASQGSVFRRRPRAPSPRSGCRRTAARWP